VLQKLGDHIKACFARGECQGAAEAATDPMLRDQLLALEQQWPHVAKSYEFIASLERFLLDQQKHTLPTEVEQLPKDAPDISRDEAEARSHPSAEGYPAF
jgi:hypothetical protein